MKNLVDNVMINAYHAYEKYRHFTGTQKKELIFTIAANLENQKEILTQLAKKETHLNEDRLSAELDRTVFQMRSYAEAAEKGYHLGLRIDHAGENGQDTRKMNIPIGPVAVFGAANFPFAYSTAGGDTACALAAGCSVIVKAHPGHPLTGEAVSNCIKMALPEALKHLFQYISNSDNKISEELIKHPFTAAVGFTGSLTAGRLFYNWAAQREIPIPVFAEMSSVNPVFLLTEKLKEEASEMGKIIANSLTQSAGQFCTNPGIIVGIESAELDTFINTLTDILKSMSGQPMLNPDILKNFHTSSQRALNTPGVTEITNAQRENNLISYPILATVSADNFLQSPILQKEVFGMYSLVIKAKNIDEMLKVASAMEGQLTCTVWATQNDIKNNEPLIKTLQLKCGRFIFNGVPTGVRVAMSMQHGGPYPATTDSRFTAVGADGIVRFCRPLCFQNWPNELLPIELQNNNLLKLYRIINNIGAIH